MFNGVNKKWTKSKALGFWMHDRSFACKKKDVQPMQHMDAADNAAVSIPVIWN